MAPPRTRPPRLGNTAGMRACSCPQSSGGAPVRYSWVPRSIWFAHRRLRSGRPPRSSRGAAAAAAPAAAAPAAANSVPAASSAAHGPMAEDKGAGEGGGVGLAEAGAGGADEVQPAQATEHHHLRPNVVCIPAQVFQDNIDDFAAYNFIVQHCLCREAAEDYLHQRRSSGSCRTPSVLDSMTESCVDLHIRKVECCSAGCVAFTAHRKCFTAYDIGKAPRHRAGGDPHKHAIYWPLLPWLRMMLVDSEMRTDMVKAMTEAREAAATSPVQGLRDWFDGATFHNLLESWATSRRPRAFP